MSAKWGIERSRWESEQSKRKSSAKMSGKSNLKKKYESDAEDDK